jgi:RimJ/RimL family protein N-acetyltransferase
MQQSELYFRKAVDNDAELLFTWINDSEARVQSLSTNYISYTEHINWFSKKLLDNNCYLYIAYKDRVPVGMIRFDVDNDLCSISYLVDKIQRGKGIGSSIVYAGIRQFKKDSNFTGLLTAVVKSINDASLKIFEKFGFEKETGPAGLINFKKLIV